MFLVGEREEYTPKGPDVNLLVDLVVPVKVDHLGRTVHERRKLGDALLLLDELAARSLRREPPRGGAPKVAEDVLSAWSAEDILELQVAVRHSWLLRVHPRHTDCHHLEDFEDPVDRKRR